LKIALLGAETGPGLELYRALRTNSSDDILPCVQRRPAARLGLQGWVLCDLARPAELSPFLDGVDVAIHAAGPFSGAHQGVVDTVIEAGAHYFDLCDDRLYLQNVTGRDFVARERGVSIVCGLLPCPGISTVLASDLVRDWSVIKALRVYLWPGNLLLRSPAYFNGLFDMVGAPIARREWKSIVSVLGWGEPEKVGFLDPVGVATVRSGDVPDLDIAPRVFGAESAVFKVGFDSLALRWGLGCAARLRRSFQRTTLKTLRQATAAALRLSRSRRDPYMALRVVAEGERHGQAVSRSSSIVETRPNSGLALGAVLHSVERVRAGELGGAGVCEAASWTTTQALIDFLKDRYDARVDVT
jgi:hypothetical protein